MNPIIALVLGLLVGNVIGYKQGEHYVKQNVVVEWFPLNQSFSFYGTCQTEVYFDNVRGRACARIRE